MFIVRLVALGGLAADNTGVCSTLAANSLNYIIIIVALD